MLAVCPRRPPSVILDLGDLVHYLLITSYYRGTVVVAHFHRASLSVYVEYLLAFKFVRLLVERGEATAFALHVQEYLPDLGDRPLLLVHGMVLFVQPFCDIRQVMNSAAALVPQSPRRMGGHKVAAEL